MLCYDYDMVINLKPNIGVKGQVEDSTIVNKEYGRVLCIQPCCGVGFDVVNLKRANRYYSEILIFG